MRVTLALAVLLSGCAMTPEQMSSRTDWDVCRLSMTPVQGSVASSEAQRRGLDCRPLYPAILQRQALEDAAIQSYISSTRPPPTVRCTTTSSFGIANTTCR